MGKALDLLVKGKSDVRGAQAGLRKLGAETGRLQNNTKRSMAKTSSHFSTFDKKLGAVTATARQLGKTVAGVGAAMIGIGAAKSAVSTTVELAKATKQLGDNYGFTNQQAATYAAASKALDIPVASMTMGFQQLAKSSQAAAGGSKKQADAFKQLGVSQDVLKRGNMQEILEATSESLKNMPGSAKRAAIANTIFGRGFAKLRPLLKGGKDGLAEISNQVKKYGAAVTDQKSVKKFVESQHELEYATLGLKVALGQQLIPTLSKFIGYFTKFVGNAKKGVGVGGALRSMYASLGEILSGLFDWMQKNKNVATVLVGALGALVAPGLAIGAAFLLAYNKLKSFHDAVNATGHFIGNAIRTLAGFQNAIIAAGVALIAFKGTVLAMSVLTTVAAALSRVFFALRLVAGGAATAREALGLLNFSLASSPFGAIAAVIGLAAGALVYFHDKSKSARDIADQTAKAIGGVRSALMSLDDTRLAVKESNLGLKVAKNELRIARSELGKTKRGTQEYKDALLRLRQAQLGVERATITARQARQREAQEIKGITGKIREKRQALADESSLQKTLRQRIDNVASAMGRGGGMMRKNKDGLRKLNDELAASNRRSERLRPEIDKLNGKLDSIKGHGNKAAAGMRSTGRDMGRGVAQGMADSRRDVALAAQRLSALARNTMRKWLDSHSPSRRMANEVGRPIAEGVAMGINQNIEKVTASAQRLVERMANSLQRALRKSNLRDAFLNYQLAVAEFTGGDQRPILQQQLDATKQRIATLQNYLTTNRTKLTADAKANVLNELAGLYQTATGLKEQLGDIPAMATGGIVSKPTVALIGEAGPEAVVPLGRGGRGIGNSYNITVNAQGQRVDSIAFMRSLKIATRMGMV